MKRENNSIHNVMNTEFVVGISDQATNNLNMVFNTEIGQAYLKNKKGFSNEFLERLPEFGFSSIANILAAIKLAKYMKLDSNDAIITVATDGADLYMTELEKTKKDFHAIYDETVSAEIYGQHLKGASTEHVIELNQKGKERIFNLGYYTWVEQQGIKLEDFEKRRYQSFWNEHYNYMLSLDEHVEAFNSI